VFTINLIVLSGLVQVILITTLMAKKINKIEENKKAIIQICIDRRNEFGIDQTELSEIIGCSRQMIFRFEKNEAWPGIELLYKIFDALGLDVTVSKRIDMPKIIKGSYSKK
jgi:DNA-binding XRE family transcriptional regulator